MSLFFGTFKLWTRSVVVGIVAAIVLSACSPGGSPGSSSQSAAPAAGASSKPVVPTGSLLWDTVFGPTLLDPGTMTASLHGAINNAVYDTLVTFRGADASKVVGNLAEKWVISPDSKTFTFTLRSGITFADGTPLTSADVLFSYNRLKNLKSGASFRAAALSFAAPDPKTFVVTSNTGDAGLLVTLTGYNFSVINSAAAKAQGADDSADAATKDKTSGYLDKTSLGSGPYVLKANEGTTRVLLDANAKYWGPTKPSFQQIIIRNVPAAAQLINVLADESDIAMELVPDQITKLPPSGKYNVVSDPSIRFFFMFMNDSAKVSAISSNADFQDAVRYGVDYDALVALGGKGAGRASLIPPVVAGALPANQLLQRDLAKAKAALAKSGIANPAITLTYSSDQAQNGIPQSAVAQGVQASLKEVGINVTLKPIPQATMLPQVNDASVEMGIWTSNNFPELNQFLPFCPADFPGSLWGKRSNYIDPPATKLCETAAAASLDTRVAAYQAWAKYQLANGPLVPLLAPAQWFVSSKRIAGAAYSTATYVDLREITRAP